MEWNGIKCICNMHGIEQNRMHMHKQRREESAES
jgi:hypothetical protein